ncbi:hypothetical protein DM01DRAFT_1345269 [Hesseltinella vesiculosa]|uniref:Aip3p/Bud6 N-terminal domain-containing protein n=1 Tax=Hesseltinella vesiculosa TaxID=101127 RepID=A0A1X2GKT0_9FUNG|nr:hypothetical protein DM01DRAFT_1345269 [Hesseltinella vesiculosa]
MMTETAKDPWFDIYRTVTQLLTSTKSLLESLTEWSSDQSNKDNVLSCFSQLQVQFDFVCHNFEDANVDMSDLKLIPKELKKCLDNTLSEPPSHLEQYLPTIRNVILQLLQMLRLKQAMLHASPAQTTPAPGKNKDTATASTKPLKSILKEPPSNKQPPNATVLGLEESLEHPASKADANTSEALEEIDTGHLNDILSLETQEASTVIMPAPLTPESTASESGDPVDNAPLMRDLNISSASLARPLPPTPITPSTSTSTVPIAPPRPASMPAPVAPPVTALTASPVVPPRTFTAGSPAPIAPPRSVPVTPAAPRRTRVPVTPAATEAPNPVLLLESPSEPQAASLPPAQAAEPQPLDVSPPAIMPRRKSFHAKSSSRDMLPRPISTSREPACKPASKPAPNSDRMTEVVSDPGTALAAGQVLFLQWRDRIKRVSLEQPLGSLDALLGLFEKKFDLAFATRVSTDGSAKPDVSRDQCVLLHLDTHTNIQYELEDLSDIESNSLIQLRKV